MRLQKAKKEFTEDRKNLTYLVDLDNPLIENAELISIFKQILGALATMHVFGLAHRDIKPQNILYNQHAQYCQVTDFGCVKFIGNNTNSSTSDHFEENELNNHLVHKTY